MVPKIRSVVVQLVQLGLAKPYTIAYKTIDQVETLFVRIEADNGLVGLGTANISAEVTGQGNEQGLAELQSGITDGFIDTPLPSLQSTLYLVNEECKTTGAKTALDIALYDLYAKFLGVPLTEFFGQKIESLPTSVTIGIMGVEESLDEARAFIASGFTHLKVKLGQSYEQDVERMHKLREELSNDIFIRVDANQGWNVQETLSFLQVAKDLNIELIEQPMPVAQDKEMKSFPSELQDLIAADESLVTVEDATRLAKPQKQCGIYNIKLMKCGGVTAARDIADIAESADIDLMWGCNDESVVSIAAALHTALACPNTKYLDLDGSMDLSRDIASGGFILKNGRMYINGKPGLGCHLI